MKNLILDIDGTRVYIAGDTDITEESRRVSCDIAGECRAI